MNAGRITKGVQDEIGLQVGHFGERSSNGWKERRVTLDISHTV